MPRYGPKGELRFLSASYYVKQVLSRQIKSENTRRRLVSGLSRPKEDHKRPDLVKCFTHVTIVLDKKLKQTTY